MTITREKRKELVEKHRTHAKDTGSPEVQVAILSTRIAGLTEHFKKFVKDHHGRRGLMQLVTKRRRLLDYVRKVDEKRYRAIIDRLGLRK